MKNGMDNLIIVSGLLACVVSAVAVGIPAAYKKGDTWSRTIRIPNSVPHMDEEIRWDERMQVFTVVETNTSGVVVIEVVDKAASKNDVNARFRVVIGDSGQFLRFRIRRGEKWHDWQVRKKRGTNEVVDIVNDSTLNFWYVFLPKGFTQKGATIHTKTSKSHPVELTTLEKDGKLKVRCKVFKNSSKKDITDDIDLVFGSATPWAESCTSKKGKLPEFSMKKLDKDCSMKKKNP